MGIVFWLILQARYRLRLQQSYCSPICSSYTALIFFCTPCLCLLFVPFSFSPRNHISLFLHVFSRPLGVIYLFAPAYITAIASAGPTTHFRPLVHNFAVFSP